MAGLTQEYLDKALRQLASKDDVHRLEASLATKGQIKELDGRLEQLEGRLGTRISDLTSSVDRYLKRTEEWRDEHNVLQARFDRVVHLLEEKGILKEEDAHLV